MPKLQIALDQHQDKKWDKVKWKVNAQKEKIKFMSINIDSFFERNKFINKGRSQ